MYCDIIYHIISPSLKITHNYSTKEEVTCLVFKQILIHKNHKNITKLLFS